MHLNKNDLNLPEANKSYNIIQERDTLRRFLDQNNWTVDEAFYDSIELNDVVEVYEHPPFVQVYSNDEFKKHCSYSPELIKGTPLTELFWRSQEMQLALIQRAAEVLLTSQKAQPWNFPDHEVVESLNPKKRTFQLSMRWIAPIFEKSPRKNKEAKGWVNSLRVIHVFEWKERL